MPLSHTTNHPPTKVNLGLVPGTPRLQPLVTRSGTFFYSSSFVWGELRFVSFFSPLDTGDLGLRRPCLVSLPLVLYRFMLPSGRVGPLQTAGGALRLRC